MFGGHHIIFRRIKGGISSKLRTQKWGSLKTLEGFRGETTQICSENEDMVGGGGGGGIAKVMKFYLGGTRSNLQREDRPNFTLFSPKSFASPQAINNDRSLSSDLLQIVW